MARKRPERPVFFTDRCLGRLEVPEALRAAGARVEIHDDHFGPEVDDVTWLSAVGERGWVVLTKDRMIERREIELAALREAGVAAFVLRGGSLPGPVVARAFVLGLGAMESAVRERRPPFIAALFRNGGVVLTGRAPRRRRKERG